VWQHFTLNGLSLPDLTGMEQAPPIDAPLATDDFVDIDRDFNESFEGNVNFAKASNNSSGYGLGYVFGSFAAGAAVAGALLYEKKKQPVDNFQSLL